MYLQEKDNIIICKKCGSRDIIVTADINLYTEEIVKIDREKNRLCWCHSCFETTPSLFIDNNLFKLQIQILDIDDELSLKEFENEYVYSLSQGEISSIRLLEINNEITIYGDNDIITVRRSE